MTPVLRTRSRAFAAAMVVTGCLVTACSAPTESASDADSSGPVEQHAVTIDNCGVEVEYQAPAQRMFINDSNLISIALAAGAGENIAALTVKEDEKLLPKLYGEEYTSLPVVAERPNMELAVAQNTDLMFAGWSYGFSEESGFTPDALKERGIASYILSESCRSSESARGTMDPWAALDTDLHNIGQIAGDPEKAQATITEIGDRRTALEQAPQAEDKPVAFLFDSGTDTPITSGSFGGPQAILEAAGARNAMEDLEDTWTTTGWEQVAAAAPDVFVFVDYAPQTLADKIEVLRTNPATRDLPAVKENRFINLPYMFWTSGPQNIDAAEIVRKGLEHFELVPRSEIEPELSITELGVDGNEWAQ